MTELTELCDERKMFGELQPGTSLLSSIVWLQLFHDYIWKFYGPAQRAGANANICPIITKTWLTGM